MFIINLSKFFFKVHEIFRNVYSFIQGFSGVQDGQKRIVKTTSDPNSSYGSKDNIRLKFPGTFQFLKIL